MAILHSYATHVVSHADTQREIKEKHLSFALCLFQKVLSEAIYHPVVYAGVGCCSEKLAWIKCQPWSRFTLTGATVNLFKLEQISLH